MRWLVWGGEVKGGRGVSYSGMIKLEEVRERIEVSCSVVIEVR